MIQRKSPLNNEIYWDNTKFEKFLLYKICYPVVNKIGLNRKFNILIHRLGLVGELPNRNCKWCGEKHIRFSEWKEKSLQDLKKTLINQ